ncbi:hypothetical protein TRIP_E160210 [uncultured Spirochaetota bacterium]|uniref:Uncharacterized protein n=1 Tax=uncultured Spirochaetota bacterium TaxID=460511 RepID=A0A652ZTA5_9SPIR|nr:hypothetical protein TRIP_E160210 [uncultured Spirochaetota bacterium]
MRAIHSGISMKLGELSLLLDRQILINRELPFGDVRNECLGHRADPLRYLDSIQCWQ